MLTGKCKKDFDEWAMEISEFKSIIQHYKAKSPTIYWVGAFHEYMQVGVYLNFFNDVGLFLSTYNNHSGYGYQIHKGGHSGTFVTDTSAEWDTLDDAFKELIKEANKIYNK